MVPECVTSMGRTSGLAPVAAIALPAFGQPLGNEYLAQALAIAGDDPQIAAILVLIAVDGLQGKATLVEQGQQAHLGALAESFFGGAAGTGDFRGVDIGNADLAALVPDRVAVDDAGGAVGAKADAEAGAVRIDADGCCAGGRAPAEENGEKQRRAQSNGDDDEGGPADVVHRLKNSGEMLKEIKWQCLKARGWESAGVWQPAAPARAAVAIFGDQITKDALLLTAGPIEALSRMAAETKEAKAAARRV